MTFFLPRLQSLPLQPSTLTAGAKPTPEFISKAVPLHTLPSEASSPAPLLIRCPHSRQPVPNPRPKFIAKAVPWHTSARGLFSSPRFSPNVRALGSTISQTDCSAAVGTPVTGRLARGHVASFSSLLFSSPPQV